MKKAFVLSLLALALTLTLVASFLVVGIAFVGPAPKVDVCHSEGNGQYHLINISENAFDKHLAHGDAGAGELVPGVPGKKFADDCTLVDANANVTGNWTGASGLAGNLAFPFTMTLTQDGSGNVTGTINYANGIVRTVTGSVSGNTFDFRTHDNPANPNAAYWADCTCIVSVDGNSFHGLGIDSSSLAVEFDATRVP